MTDRGFPAPPSEFSPKKIRLKHVLDLVAASDDRASAVEAIRQAYFLDTKGATAEAKARNEKTRAGNVIIGLSAFDLVEGDSLTPLGEELRKLPEAELDEAFAKHILLHRHGLEMLAAIRELHLRGQTVTKDSLANELRGAPYNFNLPRDTTKHTTTLLWLRQVGILPASGTKGYEINEARLSELTGGTSIETVHDWQALDHPQQVFIRTLRRMAELSGRGSVEVSAVLDQAELENGRTFVGATLSRAVLAPLETNGWIQRSGTTSGRGARSGRVTPTQKLMDVDFEVLVGFPRPTLPPEVHARLRTSLEQIGADLRAKKADGSEDKHTRGLALELLSVRFVNDLGLTPVGFRIRGSQTGGAEVDLIAEGAQLHFSRWLIQCKNEATKADLSALAKEIGLAVLLRANVVVLVSMSGFRSSVIEHAQKTAEVTAVQVVLVDGHVINSYLSSGPASLRAYFHQSASDTMRLKRSQVDGTESP